MQPEHKPVHVRGLGRQGPFSIWRSPHTPWELARRKEVWKGEFNPVSALELVHSFYALRHQSSGLPALALQDVECTLGFLDFAFFRHGLSHTTSVLVSILQNSGCCWALLSPSDSIRPIALIDMRWTQGLQKSNS